MTLVQPVKPVCQPVCQRVAPTKAPLQIELEAINGIPWKQLGQARAEVRGRVSVVTPTTASRARFHPQLWRCFLDQSWPDKELVVVETYHDRPSTFFCDIALEDTRLKYIAIKCPLGEDLTVGAKRNLTIWMASGEYCVNFDDDDLYADKYIERMVTEMKKRSLVALTLSGWHNFFETRGCAGYSDPNSWDPEDKNEMDEILYGYGFSYVHLRVMALFYPYPNLGFAEDAPFMLKLREKTGRVGLMEDVEGLCLHIVHSTSSTPDPEISHDLSEEKLNGLAVSDCTAYEDFMDHYWENFSWITNLFTSLFHFWWSCWTTCEHAGRTNWFHHFRISPISPIRINFTVPKTLKTVLWKWAKTPLHSSLDPGNGRWVAMFERRRTDLFFVMKSNEKRCLWTGTRPVEQWDQLRWHLFS